MVHYGAKVLWQVAEKLQFSICHWQVKFLQDSGIEVKDVNDKMKGNYLVVHWDIEVKSKWS